MLENNNKPYIIGETAFHHEGDVDFLKELTKHAMDLGLEALKFHLTIDLDDYFAFDHTAIDIVRPWCFSEQIWEEVIAEAKDIDVILLCNDVKAAEFANKTKHTIKAVEIHATGLNDTFLLEEASKFKGTVILGTGGSTLDEIDYAINFLKERGQHDIFLMHGFQNYPTDYKDIKLARMKKLSELFDLPIGYADHTDPANEHNAFISCLGVANGFPVLEKHFTHQFGVKRIDSQAAVSLDQMKKVQELAKIVFDSYGEKEALVLSQAELKYGDTGPMKKAIVAREDIAKGEKVSLEKIAFKRTNDSSSIRQIELSKVLNGVANTAINKDAIIDLSNVDYEFKSADTSQFKNTSK